METAAQAPTPELHTINSKGVFVLVKSMAMAKEYKHKTFYHSWFVDWRGRFYPQQSWLQPQSTDFEKSLLRFRDGCQGD